MILKNAIIEQIHKDIKYHMDGAKEVRKMLKDKRTFILSDKLESIMLTCESPKSIYPTTHGSFTIQFETFEGAREFVIRAMDKLGLDKVERNMDNYSRDLHWYYQVNYVPRMGIDAFYMQCLSCRTC